MDLCRATCRHRFARHAQSNSPYCANVIFNPSDTECIHWYPAVACPFEDDLFMLEKTILLLQQMRSGCLVCACERGRSMLLEYLVIVSLVSIVSYPHLFSLDHGISRQQTCHKATKFTYFFLRVLLFLPNFLKTNAAPLIKTRIPRSARLIMVRIPIKLCQSGTLQLVIGTQTQKNTSPQLNRSCAGSFYSNLTDSINMCLLNLDDDVSTFYWISEGDLVD